MLRARAWRARVKVDASVSAESSVDNTTIFAASTPSPLATTTITWLEAATRRNLAALGCPIDEEPGTDVVLTYRERPDWTGDKTSRRLWVAERYRVLQLVGDDLNDFVAVPRRATIDYRRRLSDRHRQRWGDSWFQLPNPLYGSWEQAITPDGTSIFDSPLADTVRMLETE